MARDVVALLDYIGWEEQRDIHVVGASLGMLL
jgi:pimeloyl-ACP methyl ester carboxylesterase